MTQESTLHCNAAKKYGCEVTGITLSVEQKALAEKTLAENTSDEEIPSGDMSPSVLAEPVLSLETHAATGLIADEDTAAIEAEDTTLAPLSTLDVVGSYDSGGTRFTMYSDGSVTASGADGEQRFPSLDALRKHIDRQQS